MKPHTLLILLLNAAPAHAATAPMTRWLAIDTHMLEDTKTGLQWSRQDTGQELNWAAAKQYCDDQHRGWRLPTITELEALYDVSVNGSTCGRDLCHISALFDLTGAWFWSGTQVGADGSDGPELNWGVLMVNGARTPSVREVAYGARALCVRKPS